MAMGSSRPRAPTPAARGVWTRAGASRFMDPDRCGMLSRVRWFSDRGGMARAALLCAVMALSPLGSGALEPDATLPGRMTRAEAEAWRGRYCTGPSCTGGSGSPASAIGFGLAVATMGLLARRRGLIATGS